MTSPSTKWLLFRNYDSHLQLAHRIRMGSTMTFRAAHPWLIPAFAHIMLGVFPEAGLELKCKVERYMYARNQ